MAAGCGKTRKLHWPCPYHPLFKGTNTEDICCLEDMALLLINNKDDNCDPCAAGLV